MPSPADVVVKGYLALPSGAKKAAWKNISATNKMRIFRFIVKDKLCCCL